MLLQQVFAPGSIKIGLESEDKDELFEELVDMLAKEGGGISPAPRYSPPSGSARTKCRRGSRRASPCPMARPKA